MSARFQLDLLRPGRGAYTWRDWFLGPQGPRRLVGVAIACAALLAVVVLAGLLPAYWSLAGYLGALVPDSKAAVAKRFVKCSSP